MGIRFHCPNGHKLNVKDNQAGKRGFCPYCNVPMEIPRQSTRRSSSKESSQKSGGAGASGDNAISLVEDNTNSGGVGPAKPVPLPSEGKKASIPDALKVAVPSGPAQVQDPFDAAPANAVWYVQPATGGRFGPATTDIMRNWVQEGRVGQDSLVWCEGWEDWQPAGTLFPQFASEEVPSGVGLHAGGVSGVGLAAPADEMGSTAPGNSYAMSQQRYRRKQSSNGIHVAMLLLIVAVLLVLTVLVTVFFMQKRDEQMSRLPTLRGHHDEYSTVSCPLQDWD